MGAGARPGCSPGAAPRGERGLSVVPGGGNLGSRRRKHKAPRRKRHGPGWGKIPTALCKAPGLEERIKPQRKPGFLPSLSCPKTPALRGGDAAGLYGSAGGSFGGAEFGG